MSLSETEQVFLRDLVKVARQRPHHVAWTDRDGTSRQSALTQAEVVQLNVIAQRQGMSKSEALRQAAHVPVAKGKESPAVTPVEPPEIAPVAPVSG
jgi:hypothetical protein